MTEFEKLVLSRFDKLDSKVDAVTERLSGHIEGEEGEIKELGDKFGHLQRTVDSYGSKTESMLTDMQEAFLEHETQSGKRDFVGHYNDHKTRKRWYDRWARWIEDGFGNLVKVAIASGAVWLVYEIWQHILKGPK